MAADPKYLYPEATVRLVPGWERRSKQTVTCVGAHTAVDSVRAHTLWGHVSAAGTAKYHFFVRKFPDKNGHMVEQYLPTNVRGAGMRYLDGKSIIVESDDDGDPEGIAWNAEQIAAFIDLFGWCADVHGFARRLVQPNTAYSLSNWRRWVVGAQGFCFHSQPARRADGDHGMISGRFNPWTSYQGKKCPGDTRVRQFYNEVLPALLGEPVAPTKPLEYGVDTLGPGDDGPGVETLQRVLNERHGGDLVVDGDFGPATLAATLTAQTQLGVEADGLWGPVTASASWKYAQNTVQRRADLTEQIGQTRAQIAALQQTLDALETELALLG